MKDRVLVSTHKIDVAIVPEDFLPSQRGYRDCCKSGAEDKKHSEKGAVVADVINCGAPASRDGLLCVEFTQEACLRTNSISLLFFPVECLGPGSLAQAKSGRW